MNSKTCDKSLELNPEMIDSTDSSKGYRLLWSLTINNQNQKVVTQDIFPSIDVAKKAVHSVIDDMKSQYKNVKHNGLLILNQPKMQEDGIEYVAHLGGKFTGGSFYIRIITCDNEPDVDVITAQEIQGRFMELTVDGLGEFKFLFKENIPDDESQGKYYMEVLWNPIGYGVVDFIVGQYIDDIDETMQEIKDEEILNDFFEEEYEPEEENEFNCYTLEKLHLISPYKVLFKTGDMIFATDKIKHGQYKYYLNNDEITEEKAKSLLESLPVFAELTPDNDIRCGFCGKELFKYTGQELSECEIQECSCEQSKEGKFAI